MKKLLLLAAVAAAAALVAKKLMPTQNKNDAEIVTDVIYDDAAEAPVETSEPSPTATDSSPETEEEVPPETLIDIENS
ncbi:DLW-39 family protein [Oscillospiraceae bacterium LTW-04]|nr:DLW-39 family protein [Oscillospiraceae bacterium MB24-C1]